MQPGLTQIHVEIELMEQAICSLLEQKHFYPQRQYGDLVLQVCFEHGHLSNRELSQTRCTTLSSMSHHSFTPGKVKNI